MTSTDPSHPSPEPTVEQVAALPGWSLIEFGSAWCGICARAQPDIREGLQRHPGVRHLKVEDGRGRPLGRRFGVKLWPTLVLLRDGQEVARTVRPPNLEAVTSLLERTA